jgi:phosphotransferase system enzyme I (PtsI)
VLALVTERGGPTSHTAVLAKALGIPAIVGCAGAAALAPGQRVIVDGLAGEVTADPDAGVVGAARAGYAATHSGADTDGPGQLRDGRPITLLAAVGGPGDVADALDAGAEGVGVFRTEFCFLDRDEPPPVAEQVAAYRRVFDAFPGRPVTARTLDIGADKPARFVPLGDQANPALGLRGLRVARRFPQLLADQLTALGRAAADSPAQVQVMAPMVATVGEAAWFAAQAREHGVRRAGIMVEVPAAALRAGDLLRVVDFVSVGSNDLASYTFAADRADGELADLLDPWQPAFLELVASVLRAGARAGVPVTVCGEAPADPALAPVLVGLGAAALSVAPRAIPLVRASLRRWTAADCERLAAAALSADGPEEARRLVT